MELRKLNALTQKIIDKTIQEAQTFKPEINTNDELKNFFAKVYNENIIDDEDGKIEDLMESVALKSSGITGRKPAMGLVDEIIEIKKSDVEDTKQTRDKKVSEKEVVLEDVEKETDEKIIKAEDKATSVRKESEKNNEIAEQNLNKTRIENSKKINQAKEQEQKVETSANEKIAEASNNLENANAQQANASETYNNAVEATSEAAEAVAAEHSNEDDVPEASEASETSDYGDTSFQHSGAVESESDNSTDIAASQQADQALEQAQAQQAEAKDALDKANEQQKEAETQKAETDTQCKEEMSVAKENTDTTKAESEESINAAEENVASTKAEGEENIKTAEENVASTKAEGEENIKTAEEDVASTKAEGDNNVNAEEKEAQAESSELKQAANESAQEEGSKPTYNESQFNDLQKKIDSFTARVEAHGKELDNIEKEFNKSVQEENKAYESISNGISDTKDKLNNIREDVENINLSRENPAGPSEENMKAYAMQAVKDTNSNATEVDSVKMQDGQKYDLTATLENRSSMTSENLKKAINDNGLIGDVWHGIKNGLNIGDSSEDVEKLQAREQELLNTYKNNPEKRAEAFEEMTGYKYNERNKEKFINGEIELKSEKALNEYIIGQKQAVENVTDVAAGAAAVAAVAATPFTGGMSLGAIALGAGVGAGAKVGLKGLEAATGDSEYSLKEAGKDAIIGGAAGAVAPVSAAAGNAIRFGKGALTKGSAKVASYVASRSAEGAIEGSAESFTRSVIEGNSAGDVIKDTLSGATTGAVLNPVIGSLFDAVPSGTKKLSSTIKGIGSINDSVEDISQTTRKNASIGDNRILASASNGSEDFADFTEDQLREYDKIARNKMDDIRANNRANDLENVIDKKPAETDMSEIELRHSRREALEKDPYLYDDMDKLKKQLGKDYYKLKFERFEGHINSPSGRRNLYDNVMSNLETPKNIDARVKSVQTAIRNNDALVANAFNNLNVDSETATILENVYKLPSVYLENLRLSDRSFHGHYSKADKAIQASSPETLRHEFGHFIDSILGKGNNYLSNKELDNIIEKLDLNQKSLLSRIKSKKALNKAEKFIKQARRKYYDELGFVDVKAYEKDGYTSLSDIYDAVSGGAFYDEKKLSGHGRDYYSNKENRATEIFAQYFQMKVQNNTEALNMLQYTHAELSDALASMYSKVASILRKGEAYDFEY